MTEFADITTEAGRDAVRKLRHFAATNPLAHKVRDGIYTAVGLGVVTAQKINIGSQKVSGVVNADPEKVKASVQQAGDIIEGTVKEVVTKFEASLKDAGIQLEDVVKSAKTTARTLLDTYGEKLPAAMRDAADKVVASVTPDVAPTADEATTDTEPEA